MKENEYLFIGGSKDGMRLTVHEGNRIEFPVLDASQQTFQPESYRKESYHSKVKLYHIFHSCGHRWWFGM